MKVITVERNNTATISGLSLNTHNTYYVSVICHLRSGLAVTAVSDGIRVMEEKDVKKGEIVVSSFISADDVITASWRGFDLELPVIRYEVALVNATALCELEEYEHDKCAVE